MISHWDFTTTVAGSLFNDEHGVPFLSFCGDTDPPMELCLKIAELAPESTTEIFLTINVRGSSDPGVLGGPPDGWREPELNEDRILECIDCIDDAGDILQSITIPQIQAAGIEDQLQEVIYGLDIDYPNADYDDTGNDSYDDGEDDTFRLAL
jgi:hypothetical protein